MVSSGEIFVIILVVLLLFGANKIPELAKGLGKGLNEFKKASDDIKREISNSGGGIIESVRKDVADIQQNISSVVETNITNPLTDVSKDLNATADSVSAAVGTAVTVSGPASDADPSYSAIYGGAEEQSVTPDSPVPDSSTPEEDPLKDPLDEPVMDDYYYDKGFSNK